MDPERFDSLTRSLASAPTRRSMLVRAVVATLGAAVALAERPAMAKPKPGRCLGEGSACTSDSKCCSGFCQNKRRGRGRCVPCPGGIVCGGICCPDDALNACAVIEGPEGPVQTCQCPCGTLYDAKKNICRRKASCESEFDCCGSTCCNGTCCPDGEFCCSGKCRTIEECTCAADTDCPDGLRCCSGRCKELRDCLCPEGSGCSGTATCSRCDTVYTTDGMCCEYPNVAYCCTDSSANVPDGFATCCIPGVNCPECPIASGGNVGASGTAGRANVQGCLLEGGSFDNCCRRSTPGGDANAGAPCCVSETLPCQEAAPCCGDCVEGHCTCREVGAECPRGTECCADLGCFHGVCQPFS